MVATLRLIENPALVSCHSELTDTDILWCDLLQDERFSQEIRKLSQYVVDYRANLKNHLDHKLAEPHLFLLCSREKVRFNIFKRPRYNFLTKKTTFHFLVGKEQRKVSAAVKLGDHFFENTPHPKVLLEPKFVTLLTNKNEDITLSVHDFLFGTGIDVEVESKVVATGSSPSPYWEGAQSLVSALSHEASKHMSSDTDLLVYLGGFDCNVLAIKGDREVEPESLGMPNGEGAKTLALMLARAYSIYFLGESENKPALRSAYGNLLRYMRNRNLVRITLTHFYEFDSEYLHLGSDSREYALNHEFVITLEDGVMHIDGEPFQPSFT
ncbi:hypothetical protein D515_03174 [Grimontia indica]|uniref:Uncharacterized protein n=1 Tax=Grimontia indica TaxID=1056512 RepID=R1IBD4_9GAMM|nr:MULTISPECIES: hypothetical protein [Grimontia]EOD78051.1 hypothetical protein D515_03174 [Grimontia indica]